MYFVETIKNFITENECDILISNLLNEELKEAYFGNKENRTFDKKIRDSFVCKIEIDDLSKKIGSLLEDKLKFKGYSLNNVETFQFTKYKKGGHYIWHTDSGVGNEKRFCSIVIQLNDNYEGGELLYKDIDGNETEFERGKGNMFIFSSNIEHCVKPILYGDRYSIVSWITLKELPNNKTLI